MKTYNLDMRHAPSKRRLNALAGNRLNPLKERLAGDAAAIAWAQGELLFGVRRVRAHRNRDKFLWRLAVEIIVNRVDGQFADLVGMLLRIPPARAGIAYRRLGRWVCNADGLVWRDAVAAEPNPASHAAGSARAAQ